jgi:ADP-ribosylglycohydrolase
MINSAKYSRSTGEGICLQVSQGNDTDSYGATIGSILGAFYGRDGLDEKWLAPFNSEIRTTLASFHETRLDAVAERMGSLPDIRSASQ